MPDWNKKICMEHIQELKSPFEEVKELSPVVNKVRDLIGKIKNNGSK